MNYYAFDVDGNIVRRGNYSEETRHLYASDSYTLVDGDADMYRNFTKDGVLQEYTPEQVQDRNLPPGAGWVWLPSLGGWQDRRTAATEWVVVRARRDFLLSDTDWVVTKAVENGNPVPVNWKTYRQALRDIPLQADPFKLVWPTSPS